MRFELTQSFVSQAAERGADFAMVITPGYFAGALHKEALKTFFVDVAEASPIPVRFHSLFVYSLLHRDRATAEEVVNDADHLIQL